jgi:hypothetical protein
MAKQTTQQQVNELKALLRAHGIVMPSERDQVEQTDYMGHGSDEHRQFIGLVDVKDDDDVRGYTTFESPHSDKVYRLEDELGVVNLFPGVDPDKAAILMLRQKINELEGGPPEVPANAPLMWRPDDAAMPLGVPGAYGSREHRAIMTPGG